MVKTDGLVLRTPRTYARVMMAAVKLQEFQRIGEIIALHERQLDEPLHPATVLMAVNGYLL